MINKVQTLPGTWAHAHLSIGTFLALAVEAGLLINQLGEFSHRRHKRKTAKAAGPPGAR